MTDTTNQAGAESYPPAPQPVAYSLGLAKYAHSSNIFAAHEFTPDTEHADEWEGLVTLDQAQAYADATAALRARGAVTMEPANADPARELLERKARYWDVLQVALLKRGSQVQPRDCAPKDAPREQVGWEVTFGDITLTRRSLEFALWAAIKLEFAGKSIPTNLQFDLPASTASVLVPSAAPQPPAAPPGDEL